MTFRTNALKVQAFAGALFGVQVGTTTMAQVNADITSNGGLANTLNGYYASSFGSVANATVAASVAANLGLTGDALASGTAYITAQLNGAAAGARGAVISNILDLFAGLASDATFGAAATAYNARVTAANEYTGAANVAFGSTVGQGSVFTLTTGIDNFVGGAGNDVFQGDSANIGGIDKITGGAGTDTLNLTSTAAAVTLSSNSISGVEVVNFTAATAAHTATLSGLTGITNVNNNGSSVALTVGDGANSLATLAAVGVSGTASNTTVVFVEAAVTGSADAVTATVSGVTGAAQLNLNTQTATATVAGAIETINIVSTGATNSITLETNDTQGLGRVNVSGDRNITIALGTNAATDAIILDASAATGTVTITGIGAGNNFAGTGVGHTITGGSANDTFALGANYVGAEASAAGGTRDIINGGAGTDTVSMTVARVAAAAAATQVNLTSIEALTISDAWTTGVTLDLTRFAEVSTVTLNGATGTSTATVNSGTAITLAADTGDGTTTFAVAGTATTDSLTLNMAGFDFDNTNTDTFSGIETLNINTGATISGTAVMGGAVTLTQSAGATSSTIVATGNNGLTFTGVVTGAGLIDASALTGVLTVTATPAAAITIRGGSAADVITGSASADLIVGGLGADTITMGAGNDTIDLTEATASVDKVVFAAVADTDTAAAGQTKTGINTIVGFGATDTLNIAGLGDGTTSATGLVTITSAGAQQAFVDDTVYIITLSSGTGAGALTTGSTTVLATADLTASTLTNLAAYLGQRLTVADANAEGVIVLNNGTGISYVYQISGDATAGAIGAADIALVGIVNQSAPLVAANLVYA